MSGHGTGLAIKSTPVTWTAMGRARSVMRTGNVSRSSPPNGSDLDESAMPFHYRPIIHDMAHGTRRNGALRIMTDILCH
jgi:hypothetical protein